MNCNGYSIPEIKRALHPRRRKEHTNEEPEQLVEYVSLPYLKNITDRIGRLLTRHNNKTTFKPTHQIVNILRSAKHPQNALSQPVSTGFSVHVARFTLEPPYKV